LGAPFRVRVVDVPANEHPSSGRRAAVLDRSDGADSLPRCGHRAISRAAVRISPTAGREYVTGRPRAASSVKVAGGTWFVPLNRRIARRAAQAAAGIAYPARSELAIRMC